MICFLPERLLIAGLLIVFLMLLVNRLSSSQAYAPYKARTGITKNKGPVKLKLNKKVEQCIQEEKNGKNQAIVEEHLDEETGQSNRFIRVIEKDLRSNLAYKEAKFRWRNEINDQVFEKRIQVVFEQIRDANAGEYKKGIKEIHYLMDLRRNSLTNLTFDEKLL